MTDMTAANGLPAGDNADPRHDDRTKVDIACQVRVGSRSWRTALLADLTPDGFQITIFDMPARGTPLYIRFAGIQMLHAEVCWSKSNTAGCRFLTPLNPYVFEHIIATCG